MSVKRIAFTGGPCAGKTKTIEFIQKKLIEEGYEVIVIPETAHEWMKNDPISPNDNHEHTLAFQQFIFDIQRAKERNVEEYSKFIEKEKRPEDYVPPYGYSDRNIVILYDRGIMDNRAYLSQQDYDKLLQKNKYNEILGLDHYDMVFDFVSVATTMPDSYVLDGVRYEDIKEAQRKDYETSIAWCGHRNIKMIKPTNMIEEKQQLVLDYIKGFLMGWVRREEEYFEVDVENSNFDFLDEDNSRTIKETICYLGCHPRYEELIKKREYKNQTSYVREFWDENLCYSNKPILEDSYLYYENPKNHWIKKEQIITSFIHNANHYRLINEGNAIYIETKPECISELPKDIKLVDKNKVLTKG